MGVRWTTLLLLGLCGACNGTVPTAQSGDAASAVFRGQYPIQAIATVGMVADVVRNVGGEPVEVVQVMGSGVDPHLYKATRDDVQTVINGDIVFYSGLMLEGKMVDTLVKFSRSKPVYAVTERIDEAQLLEPEDFAGHYDPHVWMDVSAWSKCVDAVAEALSEYDPQHAQDYQANAESYRRQLADLHEYGLKSIASIPEDHRVLITSHDAFNYFGRAYGLDVQGVQGISTESEAGLRRINELVDLLVEKKVSAVFVESSVPRKNMEALIDGAKARGHEVNIGGELFSDAMGEAGTYEGTYVGMLDHNITTVTHALGGDAPEGGMQGKLSRHHKQAAEKRGHAPFGLPFHIANSPTPSEVNLQPHVLLGSSSSSSSSSTRGRRGRLRGRRDWYTTACTKTKISSQFLKSEFFRMPTQGSAPFFQQPQKGSGA